MTKTKFLDLGRQPIANAFLTQDQIEDEYFFNLGVTFDDETKLVSLSEFVDKERLFHDDYAYHSSMSQTMQDHFRNAAIHVGHLFPNSKKKFLEIGSNDGVFLKNFSPKQIVAVEPCGNFARMTHDMGYETYQSFWDDKIAGELKNLYGGFSAVYAANCMCHIPDIENAFKAVENVLSEHGLFIFEDPSLLEMFRKTSYDQIYDEHAHIFSLTAVQTLLNRVGMHIIDVVQLGVHGGSNRIIAARITDSRRPTFRVTDLLQQEIMLGLGEIGAYHSFAKRVEESRDKLINTLKRYKKLGNKIIGYGATSKSVVVYNYCGIGPDIIDYVVDTTPSKQNKLIPGMHIPIYRPSTSGIGIDVNVAFLGAWNFVDEITRKEADFIKRGGAFLTHVPSIRVIP